MPEIRSQPLRVERFIRYRLIATGLLLATALLAVACSSDSGELAGFEQDAFEPLGGGSVLPTLTIDQQSLLNIGRANFATCKGFVDPGDIGDAANSDVFLREDPNRFNLGVPGDASLRGIVATCVLEYLGGANGEPGSTVTITSTAFDSPDAAEGHRNRILASARTILLNLEPVATFEDAPLGDASFQLIANADRLGSMVGFKLGTTFTQVATTVDESGSALISPPDLLALASKIQANLSNQ